MKDTISFPNCIHYIIYDMLCLVFWCILGPLCVELLFTRVTRPVHSGERTVPQQRVRSPAALGEPLSLPSRFWCCLKPLQLCLQVTEHHSLPLPLLLCTYMTKKIRGFKRFFMTWECFQRTQNISSHIWHLPSWQSNRINVIVFMSLYLGPQVFQSHLTLGNQGAR